MLLFEAAKPDKLWDIPIFATSALVITSCVYIRGFLLARRTRPIELANWRCWTFLAGVAVLFLAIASPVDTYADRLLLAHMTQHLLIMSVVPPLLVLGTPVVPLLRGLPRWFVVGAIGPLFRNKIFQSMLRMFRDPAVAWLAMNGAYVGWHVPTAYELALRSESWHNCEHVCFLLTAILFWWNVLEPWPSRTKRPQWTVLPYLLTADIVNTGVSAYLCFSGRVLYPSYLRETSLWGLTPLADQTAAGAEMWVLGSLIFLIPVIAISFRLLSARTALAVSSN